MRRHLGSLLILISWLFVCSLGIAQEESLIYSNKNAALELNKKVAETELKEKLNWALSPYTKGKDFDVQVAITLKSSVKRTAASLNDDTQIKPSDDIVDLGKLGSTTETLKEEYLDPNSLAKNISTIKVSLFFHDYISPAELEVVKKAVKKVITIVPVWRIKIDSVIPPEPAEPGIFQKYKWYFLATVCLLIVLCSLSILLLKILRLFLSTRRAEQAQKSYSAPPHFDADDVRRDYTVDITPTEKASDANPTDLHEVEHKETIHQESIVENAMELMADADPDVEKKIIAKLISEKKFEVLQEVVTRYYPSELIFKMPAEVLKSALMNMNVQQRILVVVSYEGEQRDALYEALGEPGNKTRVFVQMEVGRLESHGSSKAEAKRAKKKFVGVIRDIIGTNKSVSKFATSTVDQWLAEKTKKPHAA